MKVRRYMTMNYFYPFFHKAIKCFFPMPRLARLDDAPGVIHHIIICGIERRKIFRDNKDRNNLYILDRLSDLLPTTNTSCYAWILLSNHAYFFVPLEKPGVFKFNASAINRVCDQVQSYGRYWIWD